MACPYGRSTMEAGVFDWFTWSVWLIGFVIMIIWIVVPVREFVQMLRRLKEKERADSER